MRRKRPLLLAALGLVALVAACPAERVFGDGPGPAAPAPVDLQNQICPVAAVAVKPGITAEVRGAIVHFCCTTCATKYRANPDSYQKTLRSEPGIAAKLDAIAAANPCPSRTETSRAMVLRAGIRDLLTDHVGWRRSVIVSALAGLADEDAARKRVLANTAEIGAALKPYYGDAAGKRLAVLLEESGRADDELVSALKTRDVTRVEAASKRAGESAAEVASFLNGINPSAWTLESVKSAFRSMNERIASAAKARATSDWDRDVAAHGEALVHARRIADLLADGICRQFATAFQ